MGLGLVDEKPEEKSLPKELPSSAGKTKKKSITVVPKKQTKKRKKLDRTPKWVRGKTFFKQVLILFDENKIHKIFLRA